MASSRHKHAVPRRAGSTRPTRPTTPGGRRAATSSAVASPWRGRALKVALPAAGVLTLLGTTVAVASQDDAEATPAAASQVVTTEAVADDVIAKALEDKDVEVEVTRSAERPELPSESEGSVDVTGSLLALSDDVAIRTDARDDAQVLATLDEGQSIDVTGRTVRGFTEVAHKNVSRWVKSSSLGTELPLATSEPCPHLGEDGLQPDTVKVLRAVCAEFPEVTSYGGVAGRGEHATGQALDIMVRGELGDRIAAFLQENRAELGIEYLIWKQQIWRPATSDSWRPMGNRGGDTANHFDHVHVTTIGDAATG